MVVTASQFTAGLWDTSNGALVFYLTGHTRPLTGVSFSPNGDWIITGSQDDTASIVRCEICANLPELEALAKARLAHIG